MIDLKYPQMNATLVLSYFPVKDNLKDLLKDAEKLTFKHMIKADDIQSTPYENVDSRVYGKLFEVYGDAATQIQFHATDSTDNFITGALYFYATPNYDSIYPAFILNASDNRFDWKLGKMSAECRANQAIWGNCRPTALDTHADVLVGR